MGPWDVRDDPMDPSRCARGMLVMIPWTLRDPPMRPPRRSPGHTRHGRGTVAVGPTARPSPGLGSMARWHRPRREDRPPWSSWARGWGCALLRGHHDVVEKCQVGACAMAPARTTLRRRTGSLGSPRQPWPRSGSARGPGFYDPPSRLGRVVKVATGRCGAIARRRRIGARVGGGPPEDPQGRVRVPSVRTHRPRPALRSGAGGLEDSGRNDATISYPRALLASLARARDRQSAPSPRALSKGVTHRSEVGAGARLPVRDDLRARARLAVSDQAQRGVAAGLAGGRPCDRRALHRRARA
jgi:hypothetical protein